MQFGAVWLNHKKLKLPAKIKLENTATSCPLNMCLCKTIACVHLQLNQGRNQVCIQRWARLENFQPKFPFWYTQTNFNSFKKWQAKTKKQKKVVLIFIPFPFHFKFFSSPSTIFPSFPSPFFFFSMSLFSLSSFFPSSLPLFPLPSLFPHFPLPSKISPPPNFPRVGDSPTSPTPSYATELNCM